MASSSAEVAAALRLGWAVAEVRGRSWPDGPRPARTVPPLDPAPGDRRDHRTACLHPLADGDDLGADHPVVADSEITATDEEVPA